MSSARISDRAGNLSRRIFRWCGASEIPQRRIANFLKMMPAQSCLDGSESPPDTLAVVIPCYGHASFLATALSSIANQARLPDEVVAVDDCSPDSTAAILAENFERFEKLKNIRCTVLTNDRNCGQAFSLNHAIKAVSSDLVMILNDDDYLMHDAVGVMLELFRRHKELALIGGTSIHFTNDGELDKHSKNGFLSVGKSEIELSIRKPSEVFEYRTYNDLNMTHSGSCFLKSAWEMAGGYFTDKRKRLVPFSDRDFQLRINALYPVGICPDMPFSFWRSNSSVDQGRDS